MNIKLNLLSLFLLYKIIHLSKIHRHKCKMSAIGQKMKSRYLKYNDCSSFFSENGMNEEMLNTKMSNSN